MHSRCPPHQPRHGSADPGAYRRRPQDSFTVTGSRDSSAVAAPRRRHLSEQAQLGRTSGPCLATYYDAGDNATAVRHPGLDCAAAAYCNDPPCAWHRPLGHSRNSRTRPRHVRSWNCTGRSRCRHVRSRMRHRTRPSFGHSSVLLWRRLLLPPGASVPRARPHS